MMAWVVLVVAGLLEVAAAIGLKYTEGFTKISYSAVVIGSFGLSFYMLSSAALVLPIGTAYAIWTGIGALGTALFGMRYLNESRRPGRIAGLALIVVGSIGMKAFS
jgi:quaternary ammonium compound-resistance protein SugE